MKPALVGAVLLFCAIATSTAQVRREEHVVFDKQPRYWSWANEWHDEGQDRQFRGGTLEWELKKDFNAWITMPRAVDARQPWSISTSFTIERSEFRAGYGMIVQVDNTYILFKIGGGERSYWIGRWKQEGNEWTNLAPLAPDGAADLKSPAIKPVGEQQQIGIAHANGQLTFAINGQVVQALPLTGYLERYASRIDRVGILASGLVKGRIHTFDAVYTEPRIPYVKDAFIGARKTFVKEFEGQGSRYPVMAPNGQQLYYVRSSDETSDDAWVSDALTDSTWTVGRSLGQPINNRGANNVISVSQDGNELLLYGVYNADGTSRGAGFSISRRTANGWSVPTDVASNHKTNKSNNREECVSADRSVMIVARHLEGETLGDKDLYVSFRQPDGSYGPCINLGSDVNSDAGENGPFLAADNRTLYWYSSGGGFGDADVYVSKRLDSTWQRWTPRTNLGPTINTGTWDAYFTIHPSGRYAYMNTSDGYRDGICRIDLPNDPASRALLPDPVVIVKGRVLHARTKQPLGVDIRYADLQSGASIGSAVSEPKDGRYSVVLTGGRDYSFNAERADFFPVSDFIRLEKLDQYQVIERDLLLEPIEVGATIRLNNLFFDTDKATLRPESFGELQRLIDLLRARPTMRISIDGHTDDRGTKQHNATLSKARAATVRAYLIDKGLDASRMTSAGWGSERPVTKGTTDAIRQQNRRVEFTITAMER